MTASKRSCCLFLFDPQSIIWKHLFGFLPAFDLAVETGEDEDDAAITLRGRPCQAITRLFGVTGFQAIGTKTPSKNRVAVEAIRRRSAIEFILFEGEIAVVFREVFNEPRGEDGEISQSTYNHAVRVSARLIEILGGLDGQVPGGTVSFGSRQGGQRLGDLPLLCGVQ